jgi:hypothetical protein
MPTRAGIMPTAVVDGDDRTLPMTVQNMGFLLDRLGADCAPLQFIRELTVNSIEAIQELPDHTGEIIWDFDRTSYELNQPPLFKLCIIDTGSAMTGPEMVQYINRLSSSGRVQSVDGNYGVGAKISAATKNPAGVIYLSWKHGTGAMIHLWRNPETGEYGLKQMKLPNGSYSDLARQQGRRKYNGGAAGCAYAIKVDRSISELEVLSFS